MKKSLPYLASPGSITTALNRIREASTPDRVTADFVSTVLMMKGGAGAQIVPFLKKINFVSTDGSPTDLYVSFRNTKSGGVAVAEAIKQGYQDLMDANEYFYKLADKELLPLIVQVTGLDAQNKICKLILGTINNLKSFADFDSKINVNDSSESKKIENHEAIEKKGNLYKKEIGLSYTINLNLPSTTDQAVFNAIFKSLKEHLLSDE